MIYFYRLAMKKLPALTGALVLCSAIVNAATLSDISNPNGTTIGYTLIGTGDSISKIENYGTISVGKFDYGIENRGSVTTIQNFTAGNITGGQAIVNMAAIGSFINGGAMTVGSWGVNNNATIGTITNTGSLISQYIGIHNNGALTEVTSIENTGTITGVDNAGINNDQGTITTLTNTGYISGNVGIANSGTIKTLYNSQGAYLEESVQAYRALTYKYTLPERYNVIINSTANYGQLNHIGTSEDGAPSGTMIFDIATGSVVTDATTYSHVLEGFVGTLDTSTKTITGTNFSVSYGGDYDNLNYYLAQSGSAEFGNWDLVFGLLGPLSSDTLLSLNRQVLQLRNALNNQSATSHAILQANCPTFDSFGLCVSLGTQFRVSENAEASDLAHDLVIGYRIDPHLRVGAALSQNGTFVEGNGIENQNTIPLAALYALWTQNENDLGLQVRLANSFQQNAIVLTRAAIETGEAGRGKTHLTAQSFLADMSYGFQLTAETVVRPSIGFRYTTLTLDGYTEALTDAVTDPLTFSPRSDQSVEAIVGLRLSQAITRNLLLSFDAGIEQRLFRQVDAIRARGSIAGDLTPAPDQKLGGATRPIFSAVAEYDIAPTQRIFAKISYQNLASSHQSDMVVSVNYTFGF